MIAPHIIDKIYRESEITDVVSDFVELKKSGNSYSAKSPWTNEKTASFYVVPSKQIFKCFSSGKGGDVVTFLIEHEKLNYPEALRYLAKKYNIEIEEEDLTPEEKSKAEKSHYFSTLHRAALNKYSETLLKVMDSDEPNSSKEYWDQINRFDKEIISEWGLGLAADDNKFIYDLAREKGIALDCVECGLLSTKNGNYYDFFQDRIIFPIYDHNGLLVAFSGRAFKKDQVPKYLNSKESLLFNKRHVLYGLNQAKRSIVNGVKHKGEKILERSAILVEGYTDVISMHSNALSNTVCSMGTALTDSQAKLLNKYARTIYLMRDGDAAGMKAVRKDTEVLSKYGLNVKVCPLPKNQDPDELCQEVGENIAEWIIDNSKDAIVYLAKQIYDKCTDAYDRADAMDQIVSLIMLIPDTEIQEDYRTQIQKELKLRAKSLKTREEKLKEKQTQRRIASKYKSYKFEGDDDLPEEADLEEINHKQYFGKVDGDQTGYYILKKDYSGFYKVSNFIFTPILHKFDPEDNSRIIKLENGIYDEGEIIEVPSDSLISTEKFRNHLFARGAYYFNGSKQDLDKIIMDQMYEFPKGWELKNLGWQNEGFFAYYNCVYVIDQGIINYNEAGLVEVENKHYFSPASSKIFKDVRQDNDLHEKDRYLTYSNPPIDFNNWAARMQTVYGRHAYAAVSYVLISLFRDIVFKVDNNCPHLYGYGPKGSGKSKFAESVAAVFFKELQPFSLPSGTDAAFAASLERYKNCPMIFNEFDDNSVKEERFQAIKTAFDGEGRERLGRGGTKTRSNTQKVNCTMILQGQYLSTKDDNSVVSRSIVSVFASNNERTEEKIKAYQELKTLEKKGLGGVLTELLPSRGHVEKNYLSAFIESFKIISANIRSRKKQYDERVLRNYCALVAMNKIFDTEFQFPWSHEDFKTWAENEIIELTDTISQSDILRDFWMTVQNLFDAGKIRNELHFKIQTKNKVRVNSPETSDGYLDLMEPTELLFLRLTEVQKLYAKEKKTEGDNPINFTSLTSYVKSRGYYVGRVDSESIGGKKYGAFIFKSSELGINLNAAKNSTYPPTSEPEIVPPSPSNDSDNDDLPF